MTQPFRTPDGGRIKRDRLIEFRFDGRSLQGYEGDTLASALLANDVHLVGRSFKYHRPRGVFAAGSEEPNALVTIDRGGGRVTPNLRATQVELYDGLIAHSQNAFPSLRFDLGAVAGLASPMLSAGFYYKTFMWPPSFWRPLYEPAIRWAAGLGRAPKIPDPDRYLHQYAHCDVLIIGAGPAGLAAALAASASFDRVILCDEQAEPGGSLLAEPSATIDGWSSTAWLQETLGLLTNRITILPRTTAFGWYPDKLIGLCERVTDHEAEPGSQRPRERLWQVRAATVVLATGAIERPMLFPCNDRPGIMLADAARVYLHRYGVTVGQRAVVVTNNDAAYGTAVELHRSGLPIAGIVDTRTQGAPGNADGIPIHTRATITGTEGRLRVHSVKLSSSAAVIPCDTVLVSGGWTPSVHLFSQSRGRLRYDDSVGAYVPTERSADVRAVGSCAGVSGLATCLESGWTAMGASRRFSVTGTNDSSPWSQPAYGPRHARTFVDFQNDVTTKDILDAQAEGFHSIEHIKRYTTTGMATDQGKTSNLNALALAADRVGVTVPDIGFTTYRPPYTPVTFGTFAGSARGPLFDPVRHAPLHAKAVELGAVFEDVGTWKRARYFPQLAEDMRAAVARECRAVREQAGVLDASTLGKIEVVGPDAAVFLNRIYMADIASLKPGRCRYTLLLGEDGFVRDDGIVACLDNDRFHVTTTTGGAAFVLHHMEDYLQTEFPSLRVWLTSITEQWAVISVQGPRSAELVAPLLDDIDLTAMPHMSVRTGHLLGLPTRLFRVSFTGETGYEINLPAAHAQTVWDAIIAAGIATPYGTEAMHVLRAEKGYIIVGQETDGTVTPLDLGIPLSKSKRDFVGLRSLARSDMRRADRRQLVGLIPETQLEEGAQITADASGTAPSIGHVTSSYHTGQPIALALVNGGRARMGQRVFIPMPGRVIGATVASCVFYDPAQDRLRGTPRLEGVAKAVGAVGSPDDPLRSLVATSPGCAEARLTALAAICRLNIRAGNAAATSIGRAIGVLLGSVPLRAVVSRDRAALTLGPDEWLVFAPETTVHLQHIAQTAAGEQPASVVDVSHRAVSLEIAGPRAAWCLNAFCALDLDSTSFPTGACTRTLLGKAEIVLWRLGQETFHLEVARSMAAYVWQCLEAARQEFVATPAA